jgi:hypothetical protein
MGTDEPLHAAQRDPETRGEVGGAGEAGIFLREAACLVDEPAPVVDVGRDREEPGAQRPKEIVPVVGGACHDPPHLPGGDGGQRLTRADEHDGVRGGEQRAGGGSKQDADGPGGAPQLLDLDPGVGPEECGVLGRDHGVEGRVREHALGPNLTVRDSPPRDPHMTHQVRQPSAEFETVEGQPRRPRIEMSLRLGRWRLGHRTILPAVMSEKYKYR